MKSVLVLALSLFCVLVVSLSSVSAKSTTLAGHYYNESSTCQGNIYKVADYVTEECVIVGKGEQGMMMHLNGTEIVLCLFSDNQCISTPKCSPMDQLNQCVNAGENYSYIWYASQ